MNEDNINFLSSFEEDEISEITLKEEDFIEQRYLYFCGKIIEKVDISFFYEDRYYIYKLVRKSRDGAIKNIRGKVYEKDNNIIDVLTNLIINEALDYIKDNIRSRGLLYNYIDSISNTFYIKDGILKVKIRVGFWLKKLLKINNKERKYFWKCYKK